jgi:beta-galactosidase
MLLSRLAHCQLGYRHYLSCQRSGCDVPGILHYLFNYAAAPATVPYRFKSGKNLLGGAGVRAGGNLALEPWGVAIVEED